MDNLDPNFQSDQQSKRTPLHAAAQKGSVEICHVLLQVSTAAPAPRRPRTPACPARPVPATCPSLQAGANINAVDKQQRTPLMEAVVNNHLEAARYMVQRGGCVYSKVRCRAGPGAGGRGPVRGATRGLTCRLPQEEDGSTCLHHAAKIGNLEMVSLLLSTGQVDVNAQVRVPAAPAPGVPSSALGCAPFPPRLTSDPSLQSMWLQLSSPFSLICISLSSSLYPFGY